MKVRKETKPRDRSIIIMFTHSGTNQKYLKNSFSNIINSHQRLNTRYGYYDLAITQLREVLEKLGSTEHTSLAAIQIDVASAFEEANKQLQGWRYYLKPVGVSNFIVNKELFLF